MPPGIGQSCAHTQWQGCERRPVALARQDSNLRPDPLSQIVQCASPTKKCTLSRFARIVISSVMWPVKTLSLEPTLHSGNVFCTNQPTLQWLSDVSASL